MRSPNSSDEGGANKVFLTEAEWMLEMLKGFTSAPEVEMTALIMSIAYWFQSPQADANVSSGA